MFRKVTKSPFWQQLPNGKFSGYVVVVKYPNAQFPNAEKFTLHSGKQHPTMLRAWGDACEMARRMKG